MNGKGQDCLPGFDCVTWDVGTHACSKALGAGVTQQVQNSRRPSKMPLSVLYGRLACAWFLLTAIAQLWMWPLIVAVLCYARNKCLTAMFAWYLVYIRMGPGATAKYICSWPTPLRRWALWHAMAAYFPARLVKTADLDPAGHYLFVVHPHGIISLSVWLNFSTEATGFSQAFPGLDVRVATLESNFRVPLLREYILLHGLCDASKPTLQHVLTGPPGRSAVLVVGGAAEALLAAPGTYDLVLRARRGFVRLALQTGASLVPVLAFGETNTFHTHIPEPRSTAALVMRRIKDWFGFSTPLCWGVGLLGGWGMLPLQTPLVTVIGSPITVQKTVNPTETQVDEVHGAYVAALKRLWDENCEKYGQGLRRPLALLQ